MTNREAGNVSRAADDRRWPIAHLAVIVVAAVLLGHAPPARAAATVSVTNPPATLTPGQTAAVVVNFTKSPDEKEQRVIVRLDLHSVATGARVASGIADNNRSGYTGQAGQVPCTVKVPANASGSYYFKATVAPWSLNRAIVSQYKSYPTDGTFTYKWDGGYGVTQDVIYKGTVICLSRRDNTCYCSGLAFETFVIAFNAYNLQYGHPQIGAIATASNMENFRRLWYGSTQVDREKLAAYALPQWDAGLEITNWEEAQEGDSVQLWRQSGSGHNPVFVNWVRGQNNAITGVRYWGTQNSSNGIGYNVESFGTTGSRINPSRFYLGRTRKPRDEADYTWRLGETNTADRPSAVGTAVEDWAQY